MSKMTPSGPPQGPEALLIDIDPGLIEEALAAVERASRAPAEPRVSSEDSLGGGEPQQEHLHRLQRDLERALESRDTFDRQVQDLRQAHSELALDFERFRARTRKDLEEAEWRGENRVLRPVIDVYDNVERAWLHALAEPSQVLAGLQMIVEQFKRLLSRLAFERVKAARGMVFDPTVHEAVLQVHDEVVAPGAIVAEVHAGFWLRGRLFRPARVTVSAPPSDE